MLVLSSFFSFLLKLVPFQFPFTEEELSFSKRFPLQNSNVFLVCTVYTNLKSVENETLTGKTMIQSCGLISRVNWADHQGDFLLLLVPVKPSSRIWK